MEKEKNDVLVSRRRQRVVIYLTGSIPKGHKTTQDGDEEQLVWGQQEKADLKDILCQTLEPTFLDPTDRKDDLSDTKSIVGRDLLQVYLSDVVLVDARQRRGIGVGVEIAWAQMLGKLVVSWVPEDSHYRTTNTSILDVPVKEYLHAFLDNMSLPVFTLQNAAHAIVRYMDRSKTAKACEEFANVERMVNTMRYYMSQRFKQDTPMVHATIENPELLERMEAVTRPCRVNRLLDFS